MLKRCFLSLIVLSAIAPVAGAGLIFDGQPLRVELYYPNLTTLLGTTDVVVGAGVEVNNLLGRSENIDISDTNIRITNDFTTLNIASAFNGYRFFDYSGLIPGITAVTINPSTNMTGFDLSRITFDADNIYVNFQGLSVTRETEVSLDVEAAAVPEPSTLALLGIGSLGLRFLRRRKQG